MRFDGIDEVVSNWSADQHLWIKGKLPVSEKNLSELEKWLSENAQNWTIVLLQNARGQVFRSYRGMDAVEHAMGKQLANRTDFGALKDSRTGESNGAFFILFLDERKFSYYGSDAFDKRGLGENRWVGQLDAPAISAMRNGGRIVDAVKDTVTSIEKQLSRKIASAEAAQKRAAIAKQRAIEEALQQPRQLTAEIDQIEAVVSTLRAQNAAATGDLFQLPLASWRGGVKTVTAYAESEDATNANRLADEVRGEMADVRSGVEQWQEGGLRLDEVAARLQKLSDAPDVAAVQGHLARAKDALESSRANHSKAESLYRQQLDLSNRNIDRAESEILAWQSAVRAEEHRLKVRRQIRLALLAAAVLLLLIGMIVANRLRRPARDQARRLLHNWRDQLSGKFDQLFALMDRASLVVGSSADLESRGFGGATLELCQQSIREVDELFIMSSATDQVMDRADFLIEPDPFLPRMVNTFSGRRYRRGIELLESAPIGFDGDQELFAILDPAEKKNTAAGSRSLLGEAQNYQPFRMSFDELISAYDEKQSEATKIVDRLGACIDGLPRLQDELADKLEKAAASGSRLAQAAVADDFFPPQNFNDELIPAAAENLDASAGDGRADPVAAMEGPAAKAERQLNAALRLATRIEEVRGDDFGAAERAAVELEKRGRQIRWMDDRYAELSRQADQIAELAIDRTVDDELNEFEDDLFRLRGRFNNCAKLAAQAESAVPSSIAKVADRAQQVRAALASQLGLTEDGVLAEENLSPFHRLEFSSNTLEAARGALDHGNVEAAQTDFQEIERQLSEADELLNLSEEIAKTHAERHAELTDATGKVREDVPPVAGMLEELKSGYASEVLLFSSRFGQAVGGQDSIADGIERAESRLDAAVSALNESAENFQVGKLIAAGGGLERAANEMGFARHQLALVEDQHDALKTAEGENPKILAGLQGRQVDLAGDVADRRTTRPTMEQHDNVGARLGVLDSEMNQPRSNPFAVSLALENQKQVLNAVEEGIEADRLLFGSASDAVEAAQGHLGQSAQRVRQAESDNIPDSSDLTRAIDRHRVLVGEFERIAALLQQDHGDWASVHNAVTAISTDALNNRAIMEQQLQAARAAAEELQNAVAAISVLQSWRSSHHVSVTRESGYDAFVAARAALDRGDYIRARHAAINACGLAGQELSQAKSRERRAAAAVKQSFTSSSSSFGGGSSSSGGSGFSSSSFSSGSGTSRSGW